MNPEQERILARVRKMLNLSRDAGATEGERDNALRMAHATLAKYNLDLAQAEASGQKVEDEARGSYQSRFFGRPWARNVAASVAKLFFCEYLSMKATKAKDTTHFFVGRQSNAITAAEMAKWLIESIIKEGRRFQKDDAWGDNAVFRSFCTGASNSIRRRVAQIIEDRKDDKPSTPGTSLVLASLYQTEQAKNQLVVKQAFPDSRTPRGSGAKKTIATQAYAAGREYGDKVNLSRQVGGTAQKRLQEG